jgi:spore coat polysaccharide biosynthesis protein SpsF
MRKLVACLACRNQGTRLYGKPLQNLDIEKGLTILEYMIKSIRKYLSVSDIVLGISEGLDNIIYEDFAKKHKVDFIVGSEEDVLQRLIQSCEKVNGTDIFRLTTESPFTHFESIDGSWMQHISGDYDLTALDNLPDGSGYEMIKLDAYKYSWKYGENKHRSELCSLFIREHKDKFSISYVEIPENLRRTDIRLTVDYPEDLVLCRAIYKQFKEYAPLIPLNKIIDFLDHNPQLKELVNPFVEDGLKDMYL